MQNMEDGDECFFLDSVAGLSCAVSIFLRVSQDVPSRCYRGCADGTAKIWVRLALRFLGTAVRPVVAAIISGSASYTFWVSFR